MKTIKTMIYTRFRFTIGTQVVPERYVVDMYNKLSILEDSQLFSLRSSMCPKIRVMVSMVESLLDELVQIKKHEPVIGRATVVKKSNARHYKSFKSFAEKAFSIDQAIFMVECLTNTVMDNLSKN